MKRILCLALLTTLTALSQSSGQKPEKGAPFDPYAQASKEEKESPKLIKFNLLFPGGTPGDLVVAIENATGHPLNVVIPNEYAQEIIPPLRMNQVTVADLFKALENASLTTITIPSVYSGGVKAGSLGYPAYQQMATTLTFQTKGNLSDDSIWYFRGRDKAPDISSLNKTPAPARVCNFYPLATYLERGYKVEDITTAIQTGWKLLGDKEVPSLSFHAETKLLIAVGSREKLDTIAQVLEALRRNLTDEATGIPKPPAPAIKPSKP